jgi:hypothetical protein
MKHHPWRHTVAPPPPAPTDVTSEEVAMGVVVWMLAMGTALVISLCVYHRTRSEPPMRAKRIHFSLFRQPRMSIAY